MKRAVLALALAACAEDVDVTFPDYKNWGAPGEDGVRLVVTGNAPGHSDSYRVIYANKEAAAAEPFYIGYPDGSVMVKEIYENNGGEPGAFRYFAIMRRIGTVTAALEDEGGWLFTSVSSPEGEEKHFDFCWSRCHVAAPYNGAWYDYRKR